MSFELERVLYDTEDFLRRAIGSPTRRAAKKRRMQRQKPTWPSSFAGGRMGIIMMYGKTMPMMQKIRTNPTC